MEDLRHWTDILLESYTNLIDGLIFTLPRIIAGILLFVAGWLLARLISRILAKSLKALRFDNLMDRVGVGNFLKRTNVNNPPSQLVGKLIYWLIMLLIFVGFAEALELTVVSEKIGILINYIPNVILAALILITGLYLANKLKDYVQTSLTSYAVRAGRLIGNLLFYVLAAFIILTALEQLQFNIELLTSNVMILLGGAALAFALGYGLSAREIFPNIISSYYNKGMFQIGDRIRLSGTEGEIIEITNISVVVKTIDGKRFIPAKKFITEEVEVVQHS